MRVARWACSSCRGASQWKSRGFSNWSKRETRSRQRLPKSSPQFCQEEDMTMKPMARATHWKMTWVAASMLLWICASQSPLAIAQTELRIAESSFSGETVDPINAGLGAGPFIAPAFDFLVTMDTKGQPAPGIATDWTVTNNGRDYTFNLRKGMKWHNGDEVTAEDVKFHFERMKKGT